MEYTLENIFLRVMKLIKIMSTNSLTHLREKQFCFTCNRNLYDFFRVLISRSTEFGLFFCQYCSVSGYWETCEQGIITRVYQNKK